MPHDRGADYLRDDWATHFESEAVRRGWEFRQVWGFGGAIPNQKENTGYRVEIPVVAGAPSGGGRDSISAPLDLARRVYILLHASHHSVAWSVAGPQVAAVKAACSQYGGSFVIVLLEGSSTRGYVISEGEAGRLAGAPWEPLTITRDTVGRYPWFADVSTCARLVEHPQDVANPIATTVLTTSLIGPRPGLCPTHRMWPTRRDGRWICALCERESSDRLLPEP